MFKFPKKEPTIKIVDLPNRKLEILCRDAQSFFVLFEPGDEVEFSFYDYPKDSPDNLSLVFNGAHRIKTVNQIQFDDHLAYELKSWYAEAGADYEEPSDTIYSIFDEGGTKTLMWIHNLGLKKVEKPDMSPFPTQLTPGLNVHGHEGEKKTHYIVANTVEISIGPKIYRGLRVLNSYWNANGPEMLAEYFVADTGRTVYFRRYDGLASKRYETLAGHPELEHEGVKWRHFYNCIPDHALITDVY